VSVVQGSPICPHAVLPQEPLVQISDPQQSLLCVHESPALAQPHAPLLQMPGAQQSLLCVHVAPVAWHAHVMLDVSHESTPQQSVSEAHAWPPSEQAPASDPPPDRHVMLVASQLRPEQHVGAVGSQSPP
jgi:hypothetical protein